MNLNTSSSQIPATLANPLIPVFLTGYMASGKTTFGRALANRLGRQFIDLDFYIEQRFRMTVSDIFAHEGEEEFRRKEAAMLREVGEMYNVVVSCGGGTPCFHDNLGYMNGRGLTVNMAVSPECILRRLMLNNSRRPLMAGKSEEEMRSAIDKGLKARSRFYDAAKIQFGGEELESRHEIDRSVERFLSRFPSGC